uniref:Cytochrome c oxidase subunit III n=1 Tax=Pseudomonas sp. 19-rlim TaxID=1084570 RepID=G3LGU2_9PSED|nr:cytochrome c oxidase subunit III [Pseudomonas sp. 19-rlim]
MSVIESSKGRFGKVTSHGRKPMPAEPGMWFFILGDMSIFAMFFGAYLWALGENRQAFINEASSLVVALGFANTLVLLSSSYAVARAVQMHRAGNWAATRQWLSWALAAATAFAVIKVFEYGMELVDGKGLTSSPFFMYYFVLTGLHLLHVAFGSLLLVVWRRSLNDRSAAHSANRVESVAGYWHMVDLLWLLIFSFVYIGSSS